MRAEPEPHPDLDADSLRLPFRPDVALFLDVDGTLLDHVSDPAAVRATPQLDRTLRTLLRANDGALALVSGRSIADLDRIFGIVGLPCAGQHGLEIRTPDGRLNRDDAIVHRIDAAAQAMLRTTAGMPGVMVENKGLSVTLHYRQAPGARDALRELAAGILRDVAPGLHVIDGNHAFELKPARADKGRAILALMDGVPFRGRFPVFLGDDRTDEDGFAVVNALGGQSVKVGLGPSVASVRAPSPTMVRRWLEDFADYLQERQGA